MDRLPQVLSFLGLEGTLLLVFFMLRYLKKRDAQAWTETNGKITGEGINSFGDSTGSTYYYAYFTFTYEANGQEVTGSFTIKDLFHTESFAARAVARYPVGTILPVRFDAQEPARYFTEFNHVLDLRFWPVVILLTILFVYGIIIW